MNSNKAQESALIAVPYIALLALALVAVAFLSWLEPGSAAIWTALRWLVRAGFVAGAVWAWRWRTQEPRPLWVYVWLGFATYEVVASLLILMVWMVELVEQTSALVVLLVVPLLILAFVPEVIVAWWVGLRSPVHAAYTVFPHAAATVPLLLLSGIVPLEPNMSGAILATLPVLVLAAVAAILYAYVPRNLRWPYLVATVVICQIGYAIGLASTDFVSMWATPFLVGLGIFILAVPALLFVLNLLFLQSARSFGWEDRIPSVLLPAGQHAFPISRNQSAELTNRSVNEVEVERWLNRMNRHVRATSPNRLRRQRRRRPGNLLHQHPADRARWIDSTKAQ